MFGLLLILHVLQFVQKWIEWLFKFAGTNHRWGIEIKTNLRILFDCKGQARQSMVLILLTGTIDQAQFQSASLYLYLCY